MFLKAILKYSIRYGHKTTLLSYIKDMKTIYIQEGVPEEAVIFQELIKERYEEYRYDQKRPLLSPDDLFINFEDFHEEIEDKEILYCRLYENLEIQFENKELKERNEKSDINLQNMPSKDDLVVHLTHGIGKFNGKNR